MRGHYRYQLNWFGLILFFCESLGISRATLPRRTDHDGLGSEIVGLAPTFGKETDPPTEESRTVWFLHEVSWKPRNRSEAYRRTNLLDNLTRPATELARPRTPIHAFVQSIPGRVTLALAQLPEDV